MIVERFADCAAGTLLEFAHLAIGARSAGVLRNIQTRERADAILAAGIAEWFVVGELHEGPLFAGFLDEGVVAPGIETVGDDVAFAIDDADDAIVIFQAAIVIHCTEK